MAAPLSASTLLAQEARALITRLGRIRPFVLVEPMLTAAAPLPRTQSAIDGYLMLGRRKLLELVQGFLQWIESENGRNARPEDAQRRFTFLRLQFNAVISQFDMFNDAITQRSENESGVWLAGLDIIAAEALSLPGYFDPPPLLCYLDRGVGAAIRRARTRLPGGGENPVALVRVPRERMVGSGVASSLIHEVGHQAAALLDLVPSLRAAMKSRNVDEGPWKCWDRWISEIVADFWSVARVGVTSTMGLIGVVSLPRAFIFRANEDDPHPMPWIRVHISAAIGQELYPHPQWEMVSALWESFYPLEALDEETLHLVTSLKESIPALVRFLVRHRPASLQGHSLAEVMDTESRQPAQLSALLQEWEARPAQLYRAPPCFVLAALGQGRLDGRVSPEEESTLIAKLLTHWALKTTLDVSSYCALHGDSHGKLTQPV